ncbi:uncharacterized protein LOC129940871 [Eupeodes corollae]|uniref:uncharacterized protein LOC129940871 n=1 Tax=Eupeodes corollae TaxID=290404 RepID=UPI0024939FBB|nr:uncharacterized protein LOC129940871 [Eupeodes corollae]
MSSQTDKKPFQKFSNDGGRKPFNKFKKSGKKNHSFMQNARGFGKKGNYGRGTHIEEEEFTYFLGILDTQQRSPPESSDEMVAMANNVMEQTKDKEIHLSSNQVVSKTLENLLGFADAEHLERYFVVFGEGLRPVCSDAYSSHVLQKMLETAFVRAVGASVKKEKEEENTRPKRSRDTITELKYNTTHKFTKEHRTKCSEFVVRICKFLLNNLEDFVTDQNASYLLRTAILTLAGVHIPKTIFHKGKVVNNAEKFNGDQNCHRLGEFKLDKTVFKVPDEWTEVLMEFPGRLQLWPQFKEFPYNNNTSVLLQVICIALHTANTKALDDFGKKLIKDTFINVEVPKVPEGNPFYKNDNHGDEANNGVEEEANGNGEEVKSEKNVKEVKNEEEEGEDDDDKEKPSVFKSDSATRLLQALIAVASPKLLKHIHKLFKDRLMPLINSKFGYFAATRLINYVADKEEFEAILDELSPHFEKFLQTNKANLIASLSATCLRLKTKQAALITALQNTLHCNASLGEDHPKAFFTCLVKLKPFEALSYEHKTYVGIFGSFITQDILQFNKPIFLVNSILETPIKFLVELFQISNGSYIADKFFTSPTIGEKSREKFVKLFEGFYMDLAITQCGSRVVELLMKTSNDNQKAAIAKELTSKENKLKGSVYGRILYNVLRLETFKLSPEQWKASWSCKKEIQPVADTDDDKKHKSESMETNTTEEGTTTETVTPSPKKAKKNKKNKKRVAS